MEPSCAPATSQMPTEAGSLVKPGLLDDLRMHTTGSPCSEELHSKQSCGFYQPALFHASASFETGELCC